MKKNVVGTSTARDKCQKRAHITLGHRVQRRDTFPRELAVHYKLSQFSSTKRRAQFWEST